VSIYTYSSVCTAAGRARVQHVHAGTTRIGKNAPRSGGQRERISKHLSIPWAGIAKFVPSIKPAQQAANLAGLQQPRGALEITSAHATTKNHARPQQGIRQPQPSRRITSRMWTDPENQKVCAYVQPCTMFRELEGQQAACRPTLQTKIAAYNREGSGNLSFAQPRKTSHK